MDRHQRDAVVFLLVGVLVPVVCIHERQLLQEHREGALRSVPLVEIPDGGEEFQDIVASCHGVFQWFVHSSEPFDVSDGIEERLHLVVEVSPAFCEGSAEALQDAYERGQRVCRVLGECCPDGRVGGQFLDAPVALLSQCVETFQGDVAYSPWRHVDDSEERNVVARVFRGCEDCSCVEDFLCLVEGGPSHDVVWDSCLAECVFQRPALAV